MTSATWDDNILTPGIDWRMSAALENVPRGNLDIPEVTSLKGAVRAWQRLDPEHQAAATLTPERAIHIDGVATETFAGGTIGWLAALLHQRHDADEGDEASPDEGPVAA